MPFLLCRKCVLIWAWYYFICHANVSQRVFNVLQWAVCFAFPVALVNWIRRLSPSVLDSLDSSLAVVWHVCFVHHVCVCDVVLYSVPSVTKSVFYSGQFCMSWYSALGFSWIKYVMSDWDFCSSSVAIIT